MLIQSTVIGKIDKVQKAIDRIKAFEPRDGSGYFLAFSGGKDSQCVYHLTKMAGVKFDAHYTVTSVDPPEVMRFIKTQYPDVQWDYPVDQFGKRTCMWKLIKELGFPPTRHRRYCCDILKESCGEGRVTLTGVRWAESSKRRDINGVANIKTTSSDLINQQLEDNPAAAVNKLGSLILLDDNDESRRMVEHCFRVKRTTVNPIIDWEEDDVWEFLLDVAKVPYCSLYDHGFTRVGCIGCPLQHGNGMIHDFEYWPRYRQLYVDTFDQVLQNSPSGYMAQFNTGEEVLTDWIRRSFKDDEWAAENNEPYSPGNNKEQNPPQYMMDIIYGTE